LLLQSELELAKVETNQLDFLLETYYQLSQLATGQSSCSRWKRVSKLN